MDPRGYGSAGGSKSCLGLKFDAAWKHEADSYVDLA